MGSDIVPVLQNIEFESSFALLSPSSTTVSHCHHLCYYTAVLGHFELHSVQTLASFYVLPLPSLLVFYLMPYFTYRIKKY
ncbi:hypothetical protein XELAEV_18003561mg [Xenopus laevis]|uniref:Uncharacterized protein n=1 Tax=Xenopus laevis TaxID=8355 RepID=A0A974BN58_XENLA|nr:hypothetical protein XELAEV_18003561mg [Xenopus laevis]